MTENLAVIAHALAVPALADLELEWDTTPADAAGVIAMAARAKAPALRMRRAAPPAGLVLDLPKAIEPPPRSGCAWRPSGWRPSAPSCSMANRRDRKPCSAARATSFAAS